MKIPKLLQLFFICLTLNLIAFFSLRKMGFDKDDAITYGILGATFISIIYLSLSKKIRP
ncbi:hypothetical protein OAQ99_06025 [Candidatus Kapabacteria bacterium]|nr:hypothetical protein [Candidatus Kapabacteria bacterium]